MISDLISTPSATDVSEDYITNLPESVVSHILSCLTMKEAVRTSVLSKNWVYKWTSIYKIHIPDGRFDNAKFVGFMERISHICLSNLVRSFYLLFNQTYDVSRLTSWILPILGPNLEEFTLSTIWNLIYCETFVNFMLPQGLLLKCTSLRCLSVTQRCTLSVPTVPSFLCLISLHLEGVDILNENSNSDTMVLKFPVLKTFSLRESKWLNVKFVEIHAPSLDKFSCFYNFYGVIHDNTIKIIGANIAEFEVLGNLMNWFTLIGSTVSCARICCGCYSPIVEQILQSLFNELSSVTSLILKPSFQDCPISNIILPRFDELEELELQRYDSNHDLLVELLRAAPHLKSLKLSEGFGKSDLVLPQYDKLEKLVLRHSGSPNLLVELLRAAPRLKFLKIDDLGWDDFDYSALENVPDCISFSLVEVMFSYTCLDRYHQPHLEGFILKFGAQLERVLFSICDSYASHQDVALRQDEIFTWLSTLPAASATLSIEVRE